MRLHHPDFAAASEQQPRCYSPRLSYALLFAAELHVRQRRKTSATPYVAHLLSVCALVIEDGGTENEAIASLLHDAVEDQGLSFDEIQDIWGPEVAEIVRGCTELPRGEEPWLERKKRHLSTLAGTSVKALRITAADKLHNARQLAQDLEGDHEGRFLDIGRRTKWYYGRVISELEARQFDSTLLKDLRDALSTIDRVLLEKSAMMPDHTLESEPDLRPEASAEFPTIALVQTLWEQGKPANLSSARRAAASESEPAPGVLSAVNLIDLIRSLSSSNGPTSFELTGADIDGDLDFRNFTITKPLILKNCRIKGNLLLSGCRARHLCIEDSQILNLEAEECVIDQSLKLVRSEAAAIHLRQATIGNTFSLEGTKVSGPTKSPKGWLVECANLRVGRDLHFRRGFRAFGGVRLYGARVAGSFDCSGGRFDAGSHSLYALDLTLVRIEGSLYLRREFLAQGGVLAEGIIVGRDFDCAESRFLPGARADSLALDASGAIVGGTLRVENAELSGSVDLGQASVGWLADDRKSWEKIPSGKLNLIGFSYRSFGPQAPHDVQYRISWVLRHQVGFHPDPFEQLASVYRQLRQSAEAHAVKYAKCRIRTRRGSLSPLSKMWQLFLELTVGYGYVPGRAFLWLLALLVLGTGVAKYAGDAGLLQLSLTDASTISRAAIPGHAVQLPTTATCVAGYRCFNPFIYAADVVLPIVNFGQHSAWVPVGGHGWRGPALETWYYLSQLFGWLLTGALAIAAGKILRED